jgi:hypothetical protein
VIVTATIETVSLETATTAGVTRTATRMEGIATGNGVTAEAHHPVVTHLSTVAAAEASPAAPQEPAARLATGTMRPPMVPVKLVLGRRYRFTCFIAPRLVVQAFYGDVTGQNLQHTKFQLVQPSSQYPFKNLCFNYFNCLLASFLSRRLVSYLFASTSFCRCSSNLIHIQNRRFNQPMQKEDNRYSHENLGSLRHRNSNRFMKVQGSRQVPLAGAVMQDEKASLSVRCFTGQRSSY